MKGNAARLEDRTGWVEGARRGFAAGSAGIRDMHAGGAGGLRVVQAITALHDGLIESAFERVRTEMGLPVNPAGWALAAVGGYGRGELNPHSDIDIMFLCREGAPEAGKEFATNTLHLLWDLGLNLGYSVRTASDCLSLMKNDFTIMTSLLESRLICGDAEIFEGFTRKINAQRGAKAAEDYVREKLIERTMRHKKHGDSVYLREPNIKEGAGGLRDIHAALWISRIKRGAGSLDGLYEKGLVREMDLRRLKGSRDYLLRLRNELHYLSGHRQDVLSFELQEQAAKDFGYRPRPGRMAVENFMRAYYLRARGVREVTHYVIEKALGKGTGKRWFFLPPTKSRIDSRFYVMGRLLCLEEEPGEALRARPETMLEAFWHCQSHSVRMSDMLKDAVLDNVGLVNRKLRESPEAGGIFLRMLGRPEGLYEALERMHRLKALGRFLPEFGAVDALVQHDMYHKYTVDEHSLLAVRKITELLTGEGLAYPEFKDALLRVKDRQVLFFSVLMHDTGKAAGKGHSERGAVLAGEAARRLGMDGARAEKVEFLIRNHLLMAHISQRREISEPKVIEKFCRIVDSPELLDMLYLLTYADMSAVGPELFNDWKMMLLKELHERALSLLRDEISPVAFDRDRVAGLRMKIAAEALTRKAGTALEINAFLDRLPPNYVLTVPAETAVRHFELTRGMKGDDLVLDHRHDRRGYTDLTVILHDMMGILYICAGALAAKNMNILSAQIFTGKDGIIVDTLQVTDYNKKPAHDDALWEDIKASLAKLLRGQRRVEDIMPAAPSYMKRTALREKPVRVLVDNEASDRYTVVEVYAPDRVGLLFDITRELYRQGCYISSAKVDTEVDQVVDVFYVTDIFRHKIEDRERIKTITEALVAAVSGGKK